MRQPPAPSSPPEATLLMRLHFNGATSDLDRVRLAVLQALAPSGPGERCVYAVETVLEEWLSNVARYGAAAQGVDIEVSSSAQQVVLAFEDAGPAFDPTTRADPPRPRTLEEAVPGGLGLAMIRKATQALSHERRDGRNRLVAHIART